MKCKEMIKKVNVDVDFKTRIIHKVIKEGLNRDGVFIKYYGRYCYVNVNKNEVFRQLDRLEYCIEQCKHLAEQLKG